MNDDEMSRRPKFLIGSGAHMCGSWKPISCPNAIRRELLSPGKRGATIGNRYRGANGCEENRFFAVRRHLDRVRACRFDQEGRELVTNGGMKIVNDRMSK